MRRRNTFGQRDRAVQIQPQRRTKTVRRVSGEGLGICLLGQGRITRRIGHFAQTHPSRRPHRDCRHGFAHQVSRRARIALRQESVGIR